MGDPGPPSAKCVLLHYNLNYKMTCSIQIKPGPRSEPPSHPSAKPVFTAPRGLGRAWGLDPLGPAPKPGAWTGAGAWTPLGPAPKPGAWTEA